MKNQVVDVSNEFEKIKRNIKKISNFVEELYINETRENDEGKTSHETC